MPSAPRCFSPWVLLFSLLFSRAPLPAADCNGNGTEDADEIARGAPDCNRNGVPDGCDLEPSVVFLPGPTIETGDRERVTNLAAGDFDGDGLEDLALAIAVDTQEGEHKLVIADNNGASGFAKLEFDLDGPPSSIVAARFDADRTLDIVVAGSSGLEVFLNRGGGRLARAGIVPLSQHFNTPGLAAGDLDRDGDLDLAVTGSQMEVLLGDGEGRFAYRSGVGSLAFDIEIADLNRDGHLDLLVADTRGGAIHFNAGGAVFGERVGLDSRSQLVEAADVDGDGHPDVVSAPGISIALNQGDGSFPFRAQFVGETDVLLVALLDPDQDADIALLQGASSSDPQDLVVLANDGEGIFLSSAAFPGVLLPRDLIAFRLDDDTDLDLALLDAHTGRIAVLVNEGLPPVAADSDRDGVLDECVNGFHRGDPNEDGVLNLSDSVFVLRHLFQSGPDPRCLESADANDDGSLDLTDAIFPLRFLFQGADPPPPPGPPPAPCNPDPAGSPYLGCAAFTCR